MSGIQWFIFEFMDIKSLYIKALKLSKSGEYAKAIKEFDKVIIQNPSNAEAYSDRGVAKFHLSDLKGALDDNFIWDYGDGSATDTAFNGLHSYSGALGYWITMDATFKNWRGQTCKDQSSSFLDVSSLKANFIYNANQKLVSFTDKSVNAKSWEWDFGDGSMTSIQTNPTHLYNSYGIYAVKQKVRNKGCLDSAIFVVNLKETGIEVSGGNEFAAEINPNPASDVLNITSNATSDAGARWSIYTIQGKKVLEGSLTDKVCVQVTELESGVYFVRLESGTAILTKRLVIQ